MKIGSFDPKAGVPATPTERKAAPARAAASGNDSAQVDLSGTAAFKVDAHGEGAFDAAKVERIASAIREGRMSINAGAIADRLIANAREVLERHQR